MSLHKPTIVSCPGKVLLAGGYLVLDPLYNGFVISTPSRFYTTVQALDSVGTTAKGDEEGAALPTGRDTFEIQVRSPQFSDGHWDYTATKVEGEWTVEAKDTTSRNPFVHLSISSTLSLSAALSSSIPTAPLRITILGSNDFYSQSRDSNVPPPPFQPLNVPISKAHKTGLGSSAAMVSSLTSSLLLHFTSSPSTSTYPSPSPATVTDKATLDLCHNLAQYVHSLAQGKVGSGFDVSAAVYGSQVYRKFAPGNLDTLLSLPSDEPVSSKFLLDNLSPLLNRAWTNSATSAIVSSFALPPGTTLLLADVDAGSNTPSMVGKVLKWRKEKPDEAKELWEKLSTVNSNLANTFSDLTRLSRGDSKSYQQTLKALEGSEPESWESKDNISKAFVETRDQILETRSYMRKMGEASSVPIEPPEQTKLLNGLSTLAGVIGAGVPGAGGYDAIWVLLVTSTAVEAKVVDFLTSWEEMSVRPLSVKAWVRGGTEEGEKGLVRIEDAEEVEGLKTRLEESSK